APTNCPTVPISVAESATPPQPAASNATEATALERAKIPAMFFMCAPWLAEGDITSIQCERRARANHPSPMQEPHAHCTFERKSRVIVPLDVVDRSHWIRGIQHREHDLIHAGPPHGRGPTPKSALIRHCSATWKT